VQCIHLRTCERLHHAAMLFCDVVAGHCVCV
jgi:hypothetical protein